MHLVTHQWLLKRLSTIISLVSADVMLSRGVGPRTRKAHAGLLTNCKQATCLALVAMLIVSWMSLRQLARLTSPQRNGSAGEVIRGSGWHSVLDEAERNIGSHLPRWRGADVLPVSLEPG